MIQLIVQFRSELDVTYSNGLFRSSSAETIETINNIFRSFPDVQIEPLFTGNRGGVPSHMRGYYAVSLADVDRAQALQQQLLNHTSVEAAYIKPPAELP